MSTHNLCFYGEIIEMTSNFYKILTVIKTQLFLIQSTGTGETAGPVIVRL